MTEERSRVMRSVKSRDTAPEMTVRKFLHALGYRYRLNCVELPGSPDIVLPKYRCAVFVHGCWWHGHDCRRGARIPKTNRDYWLQKVERNKQRDQLAKKALAGGGWHVITVWECEVKDAALLRRKLIKFLDSPVDRHQTINRRVSKHASRILCSSAR